MGAEVDARHKPRETPMSFVLAAELPQTIEFAKAIVAVVVPPLGLTIAWVGLKTWRRQLRGSSDHEVARVLLRSVFKLRDAIKFLRVRLILGDEFPAREGAPTAEAGGPSDIEFAYRQRWQRVVHEMADVRVQLLEAEILWRDDVRELADVLRMSVSQLGDAVAENIEFIHDRELKRRFPEDYERVRLIVLSQRAPDTFGDRLYSVLDDLEAVGRRHLIK